MISYEKDALKPDEVVADGIPNEIANRVQVEL